MDTRPATHFSVTSVVSRPPISAEATPVTRRLTPQSVSANEGSALSSPDASTTRACADAANLGASCLRGVSESGFRAQPEAKAHWLQVSECVHVHARVRARTRIVVCGCRHNALGERAQLGQQLR